MPYGRPTTPCSETGWRVKFTNVIGARHEPDVAIGQAYHRVLKLARTIADLAGEEDIAPTHLAEALQYRPKSLQM
jgi:predicted ATPase with chaperone activity